MYMENIYDINDASKHTELPSSKFVQLRGGRKGINIWLTREFEILKGLINNGRYHLIYYLTLKGEKNAKKHGKVNLFETKILTIEKIKK